MISHLLPHLVGLSLSSISHYAFLANTTPEDDQFKQLTIRTLKELDVYIMAVSQILLILLPGNFSVGLLLLLVHLATNMKKNYTIWVVQLVTALASASSIDLVVCLPSLAIFYKITMFIQNILS